MRKSADEVTRMEGNCRRVRNCVPVSIPSGSRRAPGPERQRVGQTPGERASLLRGYDNAPSTRLRREAIGPWQGSGAAVSAQRVLMAPTSLGRTAALDAPSRRVRLLAPGVSKATSPTSTPPATCKDQFRDKAIRGASAFPSETRNMNQCLMPIGRPPRIQGCTSSWHYHATAGPARLRGCSEPGTLNLRLVHVD